jgi:release factor glutamine methyltransferase
LSILITAIDYPEQMNNPWRHSFLEFVGSLLGEREAYSIFKIICQDMNLRPDGGDLSQRENWFQIIKRLRDSEPTQYITGKVFFMGLELEVNKHVLIPRPETEELADLIIRFYKQNHVHPTRILDVGTGSGCLILTLKTAFPHAECYGIDISEDALTVAKINADKLEQEVQFQQIDFLNPDEWPSIFGEFDLIVSNPPYISHGEKHLMNEGVLKFEPHVALFASEVDVLEFYRALADFSIDFLHNPALIFTEINEFRATETAAIFNEKGMETSIISDIQGKSRFIMAKKMDIH